jgi:AcrR family transcriptional regulator
VHVIARLEPVRCTEIVSEAAAVATEFTGTGDTARSMALLWRRPQDADRRRRPEPTLDVDRVVGAAVRLADAEGLAALSMRRVATELEVAAMTLYSHVPGKGELVDLMFDSVLGELYPDEQAAITGNWRARLDAVARADRAFFLRHRWALHVATGRPPLGPSLMRKYEIELRAVDGLGLSEVQMDLLVTHLNGFVRGTIGERATGSTEDQWWAATAPYAGQLFDAERFPAAARVVPVARRELQGATSPERSFAFGLERLLDGVGVLILDPGR